MADYELSLRADPLPRSAPAKLVVRAALDGSQQATGDKEQSTAMNEIATTISELLPALIASARIPEWSGD